MTYCHRRSLSYALTLAALACPACDDLDAPEPASVEWRGIGGYPPLNTSKLLNTDLSAVDTLGLALDGVRLVSVEVKRGTRFYPVQLSTLAAEAGELVGEAMFPIGATAVAGDDFLQSIWTFQVGGPFYTSVEARLIDMETADDAGLYEDVLTPDPITHPRKLDPLRWVYTFMYVDGTNLFNVCESDNQVGARMVIFGDILVNKSTGDIDARPNTLQFGCLTSAVGKAALWGYAPDSPSLASVTLEEFETSTRMVRADYCADGTSYTAVGQVISMSDRWGINQYANGHTTEAAWKAGQGATCLRRKRLDDEDLKAPLVCPDQHEIPLCGPDSVLGSRLLAGDDDMWTKIPP